MRRVRSARGGARQRPGLFSPRLFAHARTRCFARLGLRSALLSSGYGGAAKSWWLPRVARELGVDVRQGGLWLSEKRALSNPLVAAADCAEAVRALLLSRWRLFSTIRKLKGGGAGVLLCRRYGARWRSTAPWYGVAAPGPRRRCKRCLVTGAREGHGDAKKISGPFSGASDTCCLQTLWRSALNVRKLEESRFKTLKHQLAMHLRLALKLRASLFCNGPPLPFLCFTAFTARC